MSLQGPIIVVADIRPPAGASVEHAGAFPIVETKWSDAPTAFVSVKPSAVVIAQPGAPPSESRALHAALADRDRRIGPIVPIIARVRGEAVPRFRSRFLPMPSLADRKVRRPAEFGHARARAARHGAASHREFHAQVGKLPSLRIGDALDDATVLIAGRGPLYPALSVAMGERVSMVGALSVDTAAKYLALARNRRHRRRRRLLPRMVEAFLTVLAGETLFRDIPVAVIGQTNGYRPTLSATACPTSITSTATRRAGMGAWCRWCACTPSRRGSSVCSSRSTPTVCSIRDRPVHARRLSRNCPSRSPRRATAASRCRSHASPSQGGNDRADLERARLVTRLIRTIDFA